MSQQPPKKDTEKLVNKFTVFSTINNLINRMAVRPHVVHTILPIQALEAQN